MDQIKYIRHQVGDCVIVEFVNGSRACSCGHQRGEWPTLRDAEFDELKRDIGTCLNTEFGEYMVDMLWYNLPEEVCDERSAARIAGRCNKCPFYRMSEDADGQTASEDRDDHQAVQRGG